MKIIINPANNHNGIVIEGNPEELQPLINLLLTSSISVPSAIRTITSKAVLPDQPMSPAGIPNANAFVASLYVYQGDPTKDNGRGRFIADLLALGKTYTFYELSKKATGTIQGVHKVINRMKDAGAEFSIDGDSIRLISVPNKKYTPARRSDLARPKRLNRAVKNDKILATLSGKKIK